MDTIGFLELPSATPEAQALFDEDVAEDGYVMNVTRLWSHNAPLVTSLFDLMGQALADQHLSFRHRGILVAACASTLGDSIAPLRGVRSWRGSPTPTLLQQFFAGATRVSTTKSAGWQRGHARSQVIPTTPRPRISGASAHLDSATLKSSQSRSSWPCGLPSRQSTMPLVSVLTCPSSVCPESSRRGSRVRTDRSVLNDPEPVGGATMAGHGPGIVSSKRGTNS